MCAVVRKKVTQGEVSETYWGTGNVLHRHIVVLLNDQKYHIKLDFSFNSKPYASLFSGFVLAWCGHIVECMETNDWVNHCAQDRARNREGGSETYSWLGSRQAVQSCGYITDKPISTASLEMRLSKGILGQNAGAQMCHKVYAGFRRTSFIIPAFCLMHTVSFFCTLFF